MPFKFGSLFKNKLQRPTDIVSNPTAVYSLSIQEWRTDCVLHSEGFLNIVSNTVESQEIYEVVFKKDKEMLSLYRATDLNLAQDVFNSIKIPVNLIFKNAQMKSNIMVAGNLREIVSLYSLIKNDGWTTAHIAAYLGFVATFSIQNPEILEELNQQTTLTMLTPLHVAIAGEHLSTIKGILLHSPRFDRVDAYGNSPLHYAASSTKDIALLVLLDSNARQYINQINSSGCTPFNVACYSNKIENAKELLRSGIALSLIFPPSCFAANEDPRPNREATQFPRSLIDDLDVEEMKYGGIPFHWVKNRPDLEKLLPLGFVLEITNLNDETVVHVMVRKQRLDCLVVVLCAGASPDKRSFTGETPLHYAVRVGDLSAVQALIVFDADINTLNHRGLSPRHIAARERDTEDSNILYILNGVGATRCHPATKGCAPGCSAHKTYNGISLMRKSKDAVETWYSGFIGSIARDAISKPRNHNQKYVRIISFDGGGIRGLVTIQVLIELQKQLQHPLSCYFNWFAGTSTGAIIAALLCLDVPLNKIRAVYLTIKEKVIRGSKPYDSTKLEAILKHYLGENTLMSDIKHAKLTITGSLVDRSPAELYLFRNYPSPSELLGIAVRENGNLQNQRHYTEVKVWEACRASGAAPTYFRAFGPFLDGGLIANNPTLDILTEITLYNDIRRSLKQESEVEEVELILSMGTGKSPTIPRQVVDLGRVMSMNPVELYKNALIAKTLIGLLITQSTQTEAHIVHRAQAWCRAIGVPYFRLNPSLVEHVTIDEANEPDLLSALYQAKAFVYENKNYIKLLTSLLENDPQIEARVQDRASRLGNAAEVDVIQDMTDL